MENEFAFRSIVLIRVKGKNKPVEVFELMGRQGDLEPREVSLTQLYQQAVDAYWAGNLQESQDLFEQALPPETHSEGVNPSGVFIKRREKLKDNPPADWIGVWTLSKK